MKTLTNLALAALTLIPLTATADPMSAQVQSLNRMVGNWKGAGSLTMGKDAAKLNASISCKQTSGKLGVLCTFHATGVPGMTHEETDLFGYEPNTDTLHWFSVTNEGETHDHVAKPPTGDHFDYVFDGTQGGKPLKETITFDFSKDGKSLAVRSEMTVAGESVAVLDMKLRK